MDFTPREHQKAPSFSTETSHLSTGPNLDYVQFGDTQDDLSQPSGSSTTRTESGVSSITTCSMSATEKTSNLSIVQFVHSFNKSDRQQNDAASDEELITSEMIANEIFSTLLK